MNMEDLREFVALERQKKELKAQLAPIQDKLAVLSETLTEQFLEDGVTSMKHDGRTVFLKREFYASPKDDAGGKEPVVKALRKCGLRELVEVTYNTNRLKSAVKELISAKSEDPQWKERLMNDLSLALPKALREVLDDVEGLEAG